MTIAEASFHAGDAMIFPTVSLTKSSPSLIAFESTSHPVMPRYVALTAETPCMSWHWSGLIQTKLGTVEPAMSVANCVNGTIFCMRFAFVRMSWKYMNGSCFCAYSFAGATPASAHPDVCAYVFWARKVAKYLFRQASHKCSRTSKMGLHEGTPRILNDRPIGDSPFQR